MRSVRAAIEKLTVSEMIDIQRMLEDSAGTTEFIGLMNDHAEQLGSSLHERGRARSVRRVVVGRVALR